MLGRSITRVYRNSIMNNSGESISDYQARVMNFMRNRDKRIKRFAIGGLVAAGVTGAFFYNDIKNYFGQQTAHVASISLDQRELIEKINKESKILIDTLLNDPIIQERVRVLGKMVAGYIANDSDIQRDTSVLLSEALKTDVVTDEAINLLYRLYENPDFRNHTERFVVDIITSERVVNATAELLGKASVKALESDDVCDKGSGLLWDIFKGVFWKKKKKEG